jgi:hypothetical protein
LVFDAGEVDGVFFDVVDVEVDLSEAVVFVFEDEHDDVGESFEFFWVGFGGVFDAEADAVFCDAD